MLRIGFENGVGAAKPLQRLVLTGVQSTTVSVRDGAGREYARMPGGAEATWVVGGALGIHTVAVEDESGAVIDTVTFDVDARTEIEDCGPWGDLFRLLHQGMLVYDADGTNALTFQGRTYRFFVPWFLDNLHTAKGMQYFHPAAQDMIDLFRPQQRADGMMWSRTGWSEFPGFFDTAYGPDGYIIRDGPVEFVRQPAENHVEYLYVNVIHLCWKSGGDDAWMSETLNSAMRALDYSITDRARYSEKYGLLKRGYTIDSWDFQIHDEYTVDLGIGSDMRIDPDRTKFGVFYGDNTGYIHACHQLGEMLRRAGRPAEGDAYDRRGEEMQQRLDALAWNGRFYTHHVEEDTTVKRDLGVDEKTQISLSNAYAVNRGLPHDKCVALIKTYQELKANLPPGSPGEWYAIYPPFQKGFGGHNGLWQYMNGGIAGHAAGELARGAFEHGYESYGTDILTRLRDLIKAHGNRLWFAYTGAFPPPTPPHFTPVDLASVANMDLWDKGGDGVTGWMGGDPGNDLRELPTGDQTFIGVPYNITDPTHNGRRAVVSVSTRPGDSASVEVPLGAQAKAIYLLHTASQVGPAGVAAAMTFAYIDGSEETHYLLLGQHLAGWWYPGLSGPRAGVAWHGTNSKSTDVGISWCAIDNPHPEKTIARLVFTGTMEGAIYALAGLTLSDQPHYVRPTGESGGGPDNWAAGTAMAGLVEGLAGVRDADTAFRKVRLAPRWAAAGADQVETTIRYAASQGYIAYEFAHDAAARTLTLTLTGGGDEADCHILLPEGVTQAQSMTMDTHETSFENSRIEASHYVDFTIALPGPHTAIIHY